jgi:hypothetical protein
LEEVEGWISLKVLEEVEDGNFGISEAPAEQLKTSPPSFGS